MTGEQPPSNSIAEIIGAAAAGEAAAAALNIDDFRALADKVDLLTADIGRWESYKAASVEYIAAFSDEVRWHRRIRFGVACACLALVVFFSLTLIVALCHAHDIFGADSSHSLTALIVATISGCVVVTIAVTKGAFATISDRNAGLPMPEHLKEVIDAAKGMMGGIRSS